MTEPTPEVTRIPEAAPHDSARICALCSQPITEDHQTARRWETDRNGQSRIYVVHWACGIAEEAEDD